MLFITSHWISFLWLFSLFFPPLRVGGVCVCGRIETVNNGSHLILHVKKSRYVKISDFGKQEHVESEKGNLQPYNQTVGVVHTGLSFGNLDVMSLGLYLYS